MYSAQTKVSSGATAPASRGGAGDQLKDAARLVQVADHLVPPLSLLRQLQSGGPRLPAQGVDGGPLLVVVDKAGGVGVVGGGGGHGQHRPGVDVQDDAHPPGGGAVLLHGVVKGVFKVALDGRVDGQDQGIALGRALPGGVVLRKGVAPGVDGGQHPAVLPGEQGVVFQFQPRDPLVVHIGKAQHRGQELPLGVPAPGVLVDADAGDAVLLAEGADGLGGFAVHPAAEQMVVGAAFLKGGEQVGFLQLKQGGEAGGGQGELFLRHLPRDGPDGPAGGACGQQHPVGAVDGPPGRGDDGVLQLLPQRPPGVPVPAGQLQIGQPGGQPRKADGAEQPRHHPHPQPVAAAGQAAGGGRGRIG